MNYQEMDDLNDEINEVSNKLSELLEKYFTKKTPLKEEDERIADILEEVIMKLVKVQDDLENR